MMVQHWMQTAERVCAKPCSSIRPPQLGQEIGAGAGTRFCVTILQTP